jgi:hypothetical protein
MRPLKSDVPSESWPKATDALLGAPSLLPSKTPREAISPLTKSPTSPPPTVIATWVQAPLFSCPAFPSPPTPRSTPVPISALPMFKFRWPEASSPFSTRSASHLTISLICLSVMLPSKARLAVLSIRHCTSSVRAGVSGLIHISMV